MKKFEKICRMSQKDLKTYIANELKATHKDIVSGNGFVYAHGKFPVLLVAHMDTVHKELPKEIVFDKMTQSLYSPQGIGGDDRCGVYMVLDIIKKYNCSVLFCEDEEIGGVGARKFTQTKLAKKLCFNYIIEFDRMGANDAVFYDCANDEFEKFITEEFYETSWGSFSDISTVAPALGCAAVNLSCGYYKAHTTEEYVVWPQMKASIKAACKILDRTEEDMMYEYIEAQYDLTNYQYEAYDSDYLIEFEGEDGHSHWVDIIASSRTEAIGLFCMQHPTLTYGHILDIDEDFAWYR